MFPSAKHTSVEFKARLKRQLLLTTFINAKYNKDQIFIHLLNVNQQTNRACALLDNYRHLFNHLIYFRVCEEYSRGKILDSIESYKLCGIPRTFWCDNNFDLQHRKSYTLHIIHIGKKVISKILMSKLEWKYFFTDLLCSTEFKTYTPCVLIWDQRSLMNSCFCFAVIYRCFFRNW